LAGTFDLGGELALMLCAGSGDTSGVDSANIGHELAHHIDVLVIYLKLFVCTKAAILPTRESSSSVF